MNRLLRPREFLVRSDGRIRYVVLSTGHQLAAAGAGCLLVGWLAFSSFGFLVHGSRLDDRDWEIRQATNAHLDQVAAESKASMAEEGRRLADRLRTAEASLAQATERNRMLESDLLRLEGRLAAADPDKTGPGTDARASLSREVASLKQQLSEKEGERTLESRIGGILAALAGMIGRRDDFQAGRAELRDRVRGLEARLMALRDSQDEIVQGLAERTRSGVEEIEKTVAMTGLDVDRLLERVPGERQGVGGPYVPVDGPREPDLLLVGVASLDDTVERWEGLQRILRTLPLTSPVDSYWVSSYFGPRKDPMTGRRALHEGLDLSAAPKSQVLATAPGRVVFAGANGSYGRMVEIDHGLGIHTRYAHLRSIAVKVGDVLDYRDKIGLLGSSGRSTGPHLHYEILVDGKPHDPMKFLKAGRYVFKG